MSGRWDWSSERHSPIRATSGAGRLRRDAVSDAEPVSPRRRRRERRVRRPIPRQQLVKDDAEREDVGLGADDVTLRLLGGHVAERPEDRAGTGRVLHRHGGRVRFAEGHQLGHAEVEDLHLPRLGHHHVGRLDVPVHDPGGVRRLERARHLLAVAEDLVQRQPARTHAAVERFARQQLHDDEVGAVLLVDLVDGDDVGMVEGRRGACLLEEALAPILVGHLADHLQGDEAIEARVHRAIDHAHASGADPIDEPVVGQLRAGGEDRRGGRGVWPHGWRRPIVAGYRGRTSVRR